MHKRNRTLLTDLNKITPDMMGPFSKHEYNIFVDPHITPDFVKAPETRRVPNFPIIYEIADRTYQVNEFGMANFYVLVGDERGLVIDCGCGSFDAKSLIEHLCPLPYDVAITHAHGDHCGSMCQYDHVWLFPEDIPLVHDDFRVNQQLWENPNIWRTHSATYPDGTPADYPGSAQGSMDFYDFSERTFMGIDQNNLPEILPLTDEQVFDLGNRKVTVLHAPGHSQGCCVFVDPKTRIMFTGDSFNAAFSIPGNTAQRNLEIFTKVQKYRGDFDRMFAGHTTSGYNTANFSQRPDLLDDAVEAYRSVVNGTAVIEERPGHFGTMKSTTYGKAVVGFKD